MPIPGYLCGSISIHAPRWKFYNTPPYFNPRPRMGSDDVIVIAAHGIFVFQSTPPAWGATMPKCLHRASSVSFQSTLPHGERPGLPLEHSSVERISIHAPRMGSDAAGPSPASSTISFQSTPPHGERLLHIGAQLKTDNFNPRSPHGERLHRRWLLSSL